MADATAELAILLTVADHASSVFGKIGGSLGGLGNLGKAALGGLAAAATGVAGVAAGLMDFVGEAAAAEQVQAQLNAVLKSTQGAAGMTADAVNDLATQLSMVTPFEDDAIVAGENLLLTFTNIGKDVFPQATEVMLDMSTALGQDMKSSAVQLGKALQDPIQGVSALQRVGVNFTGAQKDQIAAMVEAGDVMGAQRFILAELATEFGGAAEAAGGTFTGRMTILQNTLGNLKETVGAAVLPALTSLAEKFTAILQDPAVQARIQEVAQWLAEKLPVAIQTVAGWFQNTLVPAFQQVAGWIQDTLVPAIQTVVGWFEGSGSGAIGGFAEKLRGVLGPAIEFAQGLFQNIVGWVQANWPLIQETVKVVMDAIKQVISTVLGAIRAFWEEHGDAVLHVLENAWTMIKAAIETAIGIVQGIIKTVMQIITGDWEGAWETVKATVSRVWDFVKLAIQTAIDNVRTVISVIWDVIQPRFGAAMDAIKSFLQPVVDWFNRVRDSIQGVIDWIGTLLSKIGELASSILPDWLTGHSPPPLAGWLADIGLAARGAAGGLGGMQAALGSMQTTTNYYSYGYNLTIQSQARQEDLEGDFLMMRALAGA